MKDPESKIAALTYCGIGGIEIPAPSTKNATIYRICADQTSLDLTKFIVRILLSLMSSARFKNKYILTHADD